MKHSTKQATALSILSLTLLAASPAYAAEPNENESKTDSATEPPASRAARAASSVFDELDKDVFLGGKFSTWVELASDYVFRGESETNDGKIPSLKAAITWSHPSGFYVGYYGANNLFPGSNDEGNYSKINALWGPYAGLTVKDIGGTGFNYHGMLFKYMYPGDYNSNYLEMFNWIDKQVGNMNYKFEYSPTLTDWFGYKDLQSHNIAFLPSWTAPHGFTVSGGIGYQFFDSKGQKYDLDGNGKEELNWWHWNVGVSRNIYGYKVDLRYHNTDIKKGQHDFYGYDSNHQIVDDRFVIAVSKSF
jgi:uncharacterized protein (TIGR02001 family)